MSRRDPTVTLREMRDFAREAMSFASGRSRADLDSDRLLQLALVRLVEVIGEAATRLTAEYRESHPDIPWRQIIAARNRLVHGYDQINLDRVWSIIQDSLPELVAAIDHILDR